MLLASLTNVASGPQFAEVCQAVSESSAPILIEFEWYRKMLCNERTSFQDCWEVFKLKLGLLSAVQFFAYFETGIYLSIIVVYARELHSHYTVLSIVGTILDTFTYFNLVQVQIGTREVA